LLSATCKDDDDDTEQYKTEFPLHQSLTFRSAIWY